MYLELAPCMGANQKYNSEHAIPAIALYSLDKTYHNHYEDNKKRLALLKRDLSELSSSRSELQTEVGSLQQKLGGLEEELAQAKAELQQLKQRKLEPTPKAKAPPAFLVQQQQEGEGPAGPPALVLAAHFWFMVWISIHALALLAN